jgi:hypothetical protein
VLRTGGIEIEEKLLPVRSMEVPPVRSTGTRRRFLFLFDFPYVLRTSFGGVKFFKEFYILISNYFIPLQRDSKMILQTPWGASEGGTPPPLLRREQVGVVSLLCIFSLPVPIFEEVSFLYIPTCASEGGFAFPCKLCALLCSALQRRSGGTARE